MFIKIEDFLRGVICIFVVFGPIGSTFGLAMCQAPSNSGAMAKGVVSME